jgi:hypothetical protein
MKGICKFFNKGRCHCKERICDCEHKYPDMDYCEDYEEQEN